ncbi:MAG: outer rane lipoprotein LolB [Pseudomonadota bacterium]|jgi:outer membrane lipoprotein LolB
MRFIFYLLTIITLFNLSSCASWYDQQVDQPAKYHQPQIIESSFAVNGRFIIRTAEKNSYGNFSWQHQVNSDLIDLISPLGNSVARISVESGFGKLILENGKTYSGTDLSQIMNEQLGFSLPLNYLHYWLQGIALPNLPTSYTHSGFNQLGWQIEYLSWQDSNHPYIVQLIHNGLRIKLLVQWS